MYYISIGITILATVGWTLSQKSISQTANPFVSLFVTCCVTAIVSAIAYFVVPIGPQGMTITNNLKELNWATVALGITAFAVETGYLLTYRSGWDVAIAPILVSSASTILLIVVSIFVFKSSLSMMNILGILACGVGLFLMNKS